MLLRHEWADHATAYLLSFFANAGAGLNGLLADVEGAAHGGISNSKPSYSNPGMPM